MSFVPSSYQQAIFDWFQVLEGNRAVNAVAGSGKSTSLIKGLGYISNSLARETLFAAFNKSIVEDLKVKLPAGINCQTIHSLGYATLRKNLPQIQKWQIEDYKYKNLARNLDIPRNYGDRNAFIESFLKLLSMAQATLCPNDPDSLAGLAERFNIDEPPCGYEPMVEAVDLFMREGVEIAKKTGQISFADMIWLPAYLGLQAPSYSLICVDEAQDLSAAQMALVRSAANGTGKVVAVGDPRQAIYGFAGAESDSFFQLSNYFNAEQLPLSICYRCPTSVVDRAKLIVPQIEAAPNAEKGIVDSIQEGQFRQMLREGDMVLCRTTAPLIKLCFELIAQRKKAIIKGRDIAATLTNTVKQVCKTRGGSWVSFLESLDAYKGIQIELLERKPNTENQIENLRDRCEAIEVCFMSFCPESMEQFIRDIESLFSDQRAGITLSTVHRAKGLENDRVFIIKPEKLPLVWKNQTASQAEQEMNLRYVAITRAQSELYFVETSGKDDE